MPEAAANPLKDSRGNGRRSCAKTSSTGAKRLVNTERPEFLKNLHAWPKLCNLNFFCEMLEYRFPEVSAVWSIVRSVPRAIFLTLGFSSSIRFKFS